jgi:hypothetical protein
VAWNLRAVPAEIRLEADMLIYLDDYRRAKAPQPASYTRYDEELLCVNWNPAVSVVALSTYQTPQELSPELPEDFTALDVEAFMNRVYALATQI